MKGVFIAVMFALVGTPIAAQAKCVLRNERGAIPEYKSCTTMVGYADGNRVGPFKVNGEIVKAGGTCPAHLSRSGRLVNSGAVQVGRTVYTLRDDCKSSTETYR